MQLLRIYLYMLFILFILFYDYIEIENDYWRVCGHFLFREYALVGIASAIIFEINFYDDLTSVQKFFILICFLLFYHVRLAINFRQTFFQIFITFVFSDISDDN